MADGYGDSGLMTNEPVLSLDEMIRRNREIRARKEEISRREDELRRLAEQQAASQAEDPGSVEGRQRHKEAMRKGPVYQAPTPTPKTVTVDGAETPYDEAVSKIPKQMDFEKRVLSSPLAQRALRRRRTEDLVSEGKSQEEAEQTAIKEQEGRASAYKLGQETIQNSPGYMGKEVRALGSGLTNSAVAMGARILGYDQVADESEATRAGLESEMAKVREEQHPYPEVQGALAGATSSSIQMLPGMIASPIAGPTAGMAIMSGQFGTQEYSNAAYEGAEAGLSGDELTKYAATQGAIEASIMPIFSKIPGLAGLEGRVLRQNIARTMAKNPKLRQAIAEGAVKLTKDLSSELGEEITTEVLHGFATEKGLNQKVDYPKVIKDTVLQTLVMMGSAQAGESAGNVASKIPAAVQAFTAKPSRKTYEAAVKAGLPPIDKPNEKARAKYAADLLKDPFGMRKPDLSGSSPPPGTATPTAATPDPATLEPTVQIESPPATVAGGVNVPLVNQFKEIQNGQESNGIQATQGSQGNQEAGADGAQGQEGRQELLSDLPAGTQDPAPPAAVNESPMPAAHTNRAEFEKEYRDTFKKLMSYPPDQAGHRYYVEKMADLFDSNPEWANEIESQKTPPVAPGGVSPDQPISPTADPVSYHSGLSRSPAEVDEAISSKTPVGVSAFSSLSAPMRKKLVNYADADGKVFVDSGAFTAFRKGQEIDWDKTLFSYHELLSSVAPDKRANVTIVAPDIVGNHEETMNLQADLFEKFTPIIELGGKVIVPVQKNPDGSGEIWKHWADATNSFAPEQNENFIVGIPFNEAAWTQDNVLEFMKARDKDAKQFETQPTPFHLLGAGPSKLENLFAAAQADGLSIDGISADAMPKKISQRKRPANPAKPTTVADERSLRKLVKDFGGISTNSVKADYNRKDLNGDGMLGVIRIKGQPLDEIAQILVSSGDLRVPENRTPADWLMDQLINNADSARADYSDAEIEAQLEAERKLYEQRKEYGFEAEVLDGLRERSEEAETLAVDAGQEQFVPFTEEEAGEIIDTSFDFGANVEATAVDDKFELKRPEKPKPKAEDFGTNPNSKQGGLFDAGKKGDKKGQELLFNSDPGDLNNPKTQENKAKVTLSPEVLEQLRADVANNPPGFMESLLRDKMTRAIISFNRKGNTAKELELYDGTIRLNEAKLAALDEMKTSPAQSQSEPSQEDLMEAILREELGQTEAKPAKERKPRTPKTGTAEPKAPKTPRSDAAKKRTDKTAKELDDALEDFGNSFGATAPMGLTPEQMRSSARLVRAALNHNVSKFNEFVAFVVDKFDAATALRAAEGIELAWRTLKRLPEYSGIDDAGKVADVIAQKKETSDVNTTTTPDEGMGGMPGESGGTLAPTTGSDAEGGNTEDASGSDGDAVSGGTDGTEETEFDGTGISTEGTGTKPSSGTKRKPGRKGSVKGGRKPSTRVPKQVGATSNLRIGPDDTIAPSGLISKLKANLAAIKLLKELQSVNRPATEAEQKVLMQYTGWGSLQHVFDKNKGNAFIERPGLKEKYGEWYSKALMYQNKDEYPSLETLQKRVEAWEKQWGDSYQFLKETLTPDEWNRAKASVLNAHFTSREVITNGIWGALEHFGVTGGRFLEPSSGIGSLIGLMPESIANDSEVIAIELDSLTGDMVKQLYPDAEVYVKGLEEVPIPAGTIDIAATNVPFSQLGPLDAKTRYGRDDMNLHNYFIARILDSLRPGGIAAVISTHFTMDSNPQDRALLASKADLVGAIRLPNSAFKANAGTEVTTDIMFFRKPDGSPFKSESWQNLASVGTHTVDIKSKKGVVTGQKEVPFSVNEYFAAHPEMVLGTHSMDGSQYSDTEYTVLPVTGANIAEQLQQAVKNLPSGIATTDNAPLMPSMDTGTSGVDGRIEFRGSKLQQLSKGEWGAPAWLKDAMTLTKDGKPRKMKDDTKAKKIADAVTQGIAYTKVRNAYEQHLARMRNSDTTEAEYKQSQKTLNVAYDAYRDKHGALNHRDSAWLERDPGFFFTSGLENEVEIVENGELSKSYAKADVFRQRTVNADAAPTTADTTEDAVKMSLAWRGAINLPWMSELTGTSEEDLEAELLESGTVFQNPETSLLEPADTYLSGNVQAKLRLAEQSVADGDKRFERNVEFLNNVQPPKMTIDSITPSLGQDWVPFEVVNRWLAEVIKLPAAAVRHNAKADIWSISTGNIPRDVQNEWGTLGMHLSDLLPKVLNGSTIRVMKPNPEDSKKTVVDEAQTQAAQIKAEKMRDSFEAWAKSDEKAIPLIEQSFNEQKNFYVKPKYNGEHLTFPGMSDLWLKRMRPYQKNTIWRAIREGRGMIAHGVGAGKTVELIATAMEMKRLGTATKPLIVVQNSTLGQFARTFTEVYPAAKVLVASKDDLNPENRAKFMARIATGNWDAIVMAKSTFNMKLPNDPALEKAMVEGLIEELEQVMLEAGLEDGKGAPSVKAIQQQINSLIKRLEKITKRLSESTDSDVYFEQMGVDALFLDEAHDYKKPPFVTKLDRSIKGLSTDVSGRALSALIKMRFIQDNNRGRNTFMATGTPITNTLGESWLLMNMVAPDVLREFGVTTFDRFVATFARVVSTLEQNAVGKLGRKTRLAKFKNGHQLAQFIQSGWDVLLGDDLHSKIREYGGGKIPKMENGKETLMMVDRSPAFDAFGTFFLNVYEAYKNLTGEDKRTYSWIPVVIYGAAKAAAIDVRLVDPSAPDDPGSKLNKMVEGVYQNYVDGTNVELQSGDVTLTGQNLTQLIFSDVSGRTDTSKLRQFAAGEGVTMEIVEDEEVNEEGDEVSVSEDRWLYNEIKRKLIAKGIPEEQVQLINDHNSTAEKLLAFQDRVNAGDVRIVIGHSDTLGTGVNVQTRLKAIWELDIPMVPAKREQRIGRMIRSGNLNEIVQSFVMAMQRSLDGTLMAMNLRKAKAAEQALSGKAGAEFDDPYSESLMSMADMEAAMNDDPLFYRQRELEFQVRSRLLEMEALDQQRSRERSRLRNNEYDIENLQKVASRQNENATKIDEALKADHPFVIEGKTIKTLKDAEKALKEKFDSASSKISKETQDSKIKALSSYETPESDHVAADAEFGPIQFNLVYGERPEVVQDEKGNPSTKWTSTSGTIITMDGKKIDTTRATTLSTLMKLLKDSVSAKRNDAIGLQRDIDRRKAENVKLAEFLAKPSDTQIELDNLQSQLTQVNDLMFQRDNPAPPIPATPDPAAGSAEAPESELRQAANEAQAAVESQKAENAKQNAIIVSELQRRSLGGAGIPVSDELARAVATRMFGEIRLGVRRFDALIKSLRADLSESDVIALKPMLISIWNAIRNKKGLDEATEADFDSAMSNTVDVDLEQAIEAAKAITPAESQNREPSIAEPSTPTPDPATQPTATGDDRTYSTKLAATDAERDRIGMKDRPAKERQSREASINSAAAFGKTEAGTTHINTLIGELTVRPRATTPFENDLLNFRYAELDQKYEAALNQQKDARNNGDDVQQAVGERDASLNLKAMMDLIQITSGGVSYALGAGLQARKAIINRDFSMARSVLEFEAAFGREPTSAEKDEMQQEIDDLKASQEQLRKLLDEASEDIESLEASLKRAHEGKVRKASESKPSDTKKTPTQKTDTPRQKAAREKIDNAYKRLKSLLQEGIAFSVGGALAESGSVFIDLATGYSELGVINLGTFLSRVTKRMGPAAKNLIPQLTAAWRQVRASADAADTSSITDRIDRDSPDTIGRAARDLHAFVIERDGLDASPEGREAAVAAVHEILVDIIPDLTLEETARAMSGIGIYSELPDNEIDVIRRDQKAQLLLLEQIVDWKKGQAPPATGQERAPVSDEQRALRKAVNEAKKASGIETTTEGQLRSALDAAKRMLINRIADLKRAIEENERITRSKKVLEDPSGELKALQDERDFQQQRYNEAFGKNELSDEQRLNLAEKALDRAISNLEADLKANKLYPDAPKARATSPEIDAKQAALDALKASRDEMRLKSGQEQERSDAAYERHLLERDSELARQLTYVYVKPVKKKPERVLTPAMLKTMLSIQKKQEALLKRRKAWEVQNRHIVQKAWHYGPVMASGMIRKGLTTIDQSLIARQGWLLGITHPIIYGKSIRHAFASNPLEAKSIFPTEQDIFNTEAALDADANWVRLEKIGKVAVTGVHGGMKKTEENYSDVPEWFDKWVPGVAGSERAGSAFINTQRRLVFRELVKQLATTQGLKGESSVSSADLRVIGNLVNVASGRASLGRWENAIQAATTVFFSPRWWASRLQTLIGQPLWHDARWTGGEGASKEVRLLAAREWGTQAFAQVAIMTLAVAGLKAAFGAPGDDEEWDWYGDPSNPNFGRIRIGSTYIDMTAGLGQHVSMLGRMITGKQVNRWETKDVDRFRMVTNHLRGKLAPTPGIFADWLDGQSIGQDPFGSKEWFAGKAVPLSIQDFVKTMNEESRTLGIIVSALMFFGMGAQTREARTKARADVANELRAMQKQNTSPEKIQATLDKHLTHTAGLEAKEKLRTANPEEVAALEKVVSGESSPELTEAIQKEKYDITLRALEMLSTEDRKKEKQSGDDKGIETARMLLRTIAPTYDEADALFKSAYRQRNGLLVEKVGGRFTPKKSVLAARRRLKAIYETK